MTQEAIARTLAAGASIDLRSWRGSANKGFIRYNRGVISILDRRGLESECCECYQTIISAYENSSVPL